MKQFVLKNIMMSKDYTYALYGLLCTLIILLGFVAGRLWSFTCSEVQVVPLSIEVTPTSTSSAGIIIRSTPSAPPLADWYTVDTNTNLRSGPSTEHSVLTVINPGIRVVILKDGPPWSVVSANGKTGYVWTELIKTRYQE